jgi:hypothetical protein
MPMGVDKNFLWPNSISNNIYMLLIQLLDDLKNTEVQNVFRV